MTEGEASSNDQLMKYNHLPWRRKRPVAPFVIVCYCLCNICPQLLSAFLVHSYLLKDSEAAGSGMFLTFSSCNAISWNGQEYHVVEPFWQTWVKHVQSCAHDRHDCTCNSTQMRSQLHEMKSLAFAITCPNMQVGTKNGKGMCTC